MREGRRESHIFQVFLLLLAFNIRCEPAARHRRRRPMMNSARQSMKKYGLLRRFAPRNDEKGDFRR
jgi:hypothetical protein